MVAMVQTIMIKLSPVKMIWAQCTFLVPLFAAPWVTRKIAYLVYNMGLTREIAKALIIDAAAGWKCKGDPSHAIGYGVVPIHISDILHSNDDEIRFYYERNN